MEHVTHYKFKKILLTGGGTGGSVAPLLAIIEDLRFKIKDLSDLEFLWLGTKNGVEKEMVEKEGIKFMAISSGKLRRYFSLRNLIDPFLILVGFFQAFFIILKWKPDLIISAGSFVSVPVVWAGWILRVPILIHQQDARAGLANKLMAPFARVVTVTFGESLKDYGKKAIWTGNLSRNMERITHNAKIPLTPLIKGGEEELPVVLIVGGGTGAMAINKLVWESLDELTKFCSIIHIIGKNKNPNPNYKLPARLASRLEAGGQITNYKFFEFLNADQMAKSYASADIVVSRAGMGVLTELANLGKPAILIPMLDSHQEDNAEIFRKKEAAIILSQKNLTPEVLIDNIKKLLSDNILRDKLSSNIKNVIKEGANEKIVKIVKEITGE